VEANLLQLLHRAASRRNRRYTASGFTKPAINFLKRGCFTGSGCSAQVDGKIA